MESKDLTSLFCVSRETFEKFSEYEIILRKWNRKINLVQENSLENIWKRHIFNSLEILEWCQARDGEFKIADLGSGAGFPGMILALSGVKNITLIESDERKAFFLAEIRRLLNVNVEIENKRIEQVSEKFHFFISRALAPLDKLLKYTLLVSRETAQCAFLKGRAALQEIEKARENWEFDVKIQKGKFSSETRIIEVENWRQKK